MCVWRPEMYELSVLPSPDKVTRGALLDKGDGVIGVASGGDTVRMFPQVRKLRVSRLGELEVALASSFHRAQT